MLQRNRGDFAEKALVFLLTTIVVIAAFVIIGQKSANAVGNAANAF